jgi:hypothetical protein
MAARRVFLTAALIGLVAVAIRADDPPLVQTFGGGNDFRVYCSSCHGASGKGDGPIASSLRRRPADLTQLTKQNDGTFPADRVFKSIDGRIPVPGHGGPDMPVWGDVFAASRESQGAENVKARIESLVKYLETIQDKP